MSCTGDLILDKKQIIHADASAEEYEKEPCKPHNLTPDEERVGALRRWTMEDDRMVALR